MPWPPAMPPVAATPPTKQPWDNPWAPRRARSDVGLVEAANPTRPAARFSVGTPVGASRLHQVLGGCAARCERGADGAQRLPSLVDGAGTDLGHRGNACKRRREADGSGATEAEPGLGVNATAAPPGVEFGMAQDAFRDAAERRRRGVRRTAIAPSAPPMPNPEADGGEPGLIERIRLNGVDSFYRGTLLGAGRLALMQHYAAIPDEPEIDPQTRRWRDQLRKDYPQVLADLARYDRMRGFGNASEFGAAAIGQLGDGLPTPESLVGVGAKGASLLWRLAKAGLQQGAFSAAVDPAVQGLNIKAGVQDDYDPWRTAVSDGAGLVTGAAAKSAADVLGRAGGRRLPADLSANDPLGTATRPSGPIITDIVDAPRHPTHLPMDEASRMRRAAEVGFDVNQPLYHGTAAEFRAFDRAFRGGTTHAPSARLAEWSAIDPGLASLFAEKAALHGRGHPQVYPLLARSDSPGHLRLSGREGELDIAATLMKAFEDGLDLVRVEYPKVPGQINKDVVAVKNENQLRSKFAAFDPAKRDSNDLLASIAALLGMGSLGQLAGAIDPRELPSIRKKDSFYEE